MQNINRNISKRDIKMDMMASEKISLSKGDYMPIYFLGIGVSLGMILLYKVIGFDASQVGDVYFYVDISRRWWEYQSIDYYTHHVLAYPMALWLLYGDVSKPQNAQWSTASL